MVHFHGAAAVESGGLVVASLTLTGRQFIGIFLWTPRMLLMLSLPVRNEEATLRHHLRVILLKMLHRCARSSTIFAEFGAIDSTKNLITTLATFLSVTVWAPFSSFVSFLNFGLSGTNCTILKNLGR